MQMSAAEFEELVADALEGVPQQLADLIDNVVILIEADSPRGQALLGLYEGIPLTQRGTFYAGALPDRITIYRNPILSVSSTYADVVREVRVTVIHEIAHHFGIDDDRLHELGWG